MERIVLMKQDHTYRFIFIVCMFMVFTNSSWGQSKLNKNNVQLGKQITIKRLFEQPPLEGELMSAVQMNSQQTTISFIKNFQADDVAHELWSVSIHPMTSPRLLLDMKQLPSTRLSKSKLADNHYIWCGADSIYLRWYDALYKVSLNRLNTWQNISLPQYQKQKKESDLKLVNCDPQGKHLIYRDKKRYYVQKIHQGLPKGLPIFSMPYHADLHHDLKPLWSSKTQWLVYIYSPQNLNQPKVVDPNKHYVLLYHPYEGLRSIRLRQESSEVAKVLWHKSILYIQAKSHDDHYVSLWSYDHNKLTHYNHEDTREKEFQKELQKQLSLEVWNTIQLSSSQGKKSSDQKSFQTDSSMNLVGKKNSEIDTLDRVAKYILSLSLQIKKASLVLKEPIKRSHALSSSFIPTSTGIFYVLNGIKDSSIFWFDTTHKMVSNQALDHTYTKAWKQLTYTNDLHHQLLAWNELESKLYFTSQTTKREQHLSVLVLKDTKVHTLDSTHTDSTHADSTHTDSKLNIASKNNIVSKQNVLSKTHVVSKDVVSNQAVVSKNLLTDTKQKKSATINETSDHSKTNSLDKSKHIRHLKADHIHHNTSSKMNTKVTQDSTKKSQTKDSQINHLKDATSILISDRKNHTSSSLTSYPQKSSQDTLSNYIYTRHKFHTHTLTQLSGWHTIYFSTHHHIYLDIFSNDLIPPQSTIHQLNGDVLLTIDANPALEWSQSLLPDIVEFKIKSVSKQSLMARLWLPNPKPSATDLPPTLVMIPHKDLLLQHRWNNHHIWYTYLTQQGYAIFEMDVLPQSIWHALSSYQYFMPAQELLTHMIDDVFKAIAYIQLSDSINPQKIALISQGIHSYLALNLLSQDDTPFRAGIVIQANYQPHEFIYTLYPKYQWNQWSTKDFQRQENELLTTLETLNSKLLVSFTSDQQDQFWHQKIMQLISHLQKYQHVFHVMFYPHSKFPKWHPLEKKHLYRLIMSFLQDSLY